ncbi:MAG: hypothetical protein ACE14M_08845 [Terriglobales bacterium]
MRAISVLFVLRIILAVVTAQAFSLAASLAVTPTTTLTAETSNNTSAANTFQSQTNGNVGAGNVSKVDHRTLLYSGASTQIYTNIMFWFGESNHMNVGYNSATAAQVQKQVDDHLSRGLTGTIVDWYGPGQSWTDTGTMLLKQYAETLPGSPFKFAIMEDKGALLGCANTPGCDVTQQLLSDLAYIYNKYFGSPAYMRIGGRPVVFEFGLERFNINWDYVKANAPGNPLFIFQNTSGFTHAATGGAFSWVMINTSNPNDWEQSYLDNFYSTALSYPTQHAFGTAYKGFNDTLASWSLNRIMNQNCGQTWLNSWKEAGKYYSSSRQLESFQITTWNDYEEGTEIESGIENCVSVSGSVSGNTLNWNISGNENTIDHYQVFISGDGENLMPLATVASGIHGLDLGQFGIDAGGYTVYVKAVGRPSMTNKMSPGIGYTVVGTPTSSPTFQVSASPSTATASTTQPAQLLVTITPQNGFSSDVSLSCSGLPTGASCSWSPGTVRPAGGAATASVTINVSSTSAAIRSHHDLGPWFALAAPFVGIVFGSVIHGGGFRNASRGFWLILGLVLAISILSVGCGSSSAVRSASSASGGTAYTVTLTGTSGSLQQSTPVVITIR